MKGRENDKRDEKGLKEHQIEVATEQESKKKKTNCYQTTRPDQTQKSSCSLSQWNQHPLQPTYASD